jgi:hypothetical protein
MNVQERLYHNDLFFRVVAGLCLGIPGALMAVFALILGLAGDSAALPIGGFGVALLWVAGDTATRYVRLTAQSIETGTMFSSRLLPLDQIAGKRITRGRMVGIILYPVSPTAARFSIGGGLAFDAAFWAWLETVPSRPATPATAAP